MSKPWVILFVAGLLEMCWVIAIKYSEGFTKVIPSAITVIALVASLYLLSIATKTLPLGTAYAVWVGIGSFGAAILGIFLFKEDTSIIRLFFLFLLLVSIAGLKITTKS